jgi:dihydropteroate synthase
MVDLFFYAADAENRAAPCGRKGRKETAMPAGRVETDPERAALSFRKQTYVLEERTLIMGVLNITPDSFSDGGKFFSLAEAVFQGVKLAAAGADLLDVGGESTRPGSRPLPEEEEIRRVVPVIRELAGRISIPLSVDTRKAEVAKRALEAGAEMINDVSALRHDPGMAALAAAWRVPVVLMHMRGEPETMQADPRYDDLIGEIRDFFRERIEFAETAGILPERIILDPGIGFGKSLEKKHNLILLKNLGAFADLGKPLLVGPSRKAFIGRILNLPPAQREEGTLGAVAVAAYNGARIVRVHEVERTRRLLAIVDAIGHCEAPAQTEERSGRSA